MMPAMDGLTFRSLQRKHPDLADIPVVGLTAFPPADADFECLIKPVRFEILVDRIRRLARGA
jgi:CheY-like chemotaxis protein